MIGVAVSGGAGRMGRVTAAAIVEAEDLDLVGLYDPGHGGEVIEQASVSVDPAVVAGADVVVEFTRPDVVMGNLSHWHEVGTHAVVGTSGFSADRLTHLHRLWTSHRANCVVVPNFSIGAVLMMRFAAEAAAYLPAAEVLELHHGGKVDSPSGTAISTAERIAAAGGAGLERGHESPQGARGARVGGVPVHSVRLPGLLAHQEVFLGGPGETLTIRHDTTDRTAFVPGILLAIRGVASLDECVTVGLESLLT